MTNQGTADRDLESTHCPDCGTVAPLPIVYGYPGPHHIRAALRGEIALGGQVHSPVRPSFECRNEHCGHTFDTPTL
ncbi:hypothetical protein OVN18_10645 [Microcella daejeonensis]|uniref:Uncharacterized protein n=1 Tax=Microcella daejeonensis TaxID=2994971 RepID=A0A9E8S892_9MICO|nr:hypothetical protein [Microcella daejeonensis]WAB81008.1 hypothetical protein OVN18_10645 [Microcella daejeonensis]